MDGNGDWALERDLDNSERGDDQAVEDMIPGIYKYGCCIEHRGQPILCTLRGKPEHYTLLTAGHLNDAVKKARERQPNDDNAKVVLNYVNVNQIT